MKPEVILSVGTAAGRPQATSPTRLNLSPKFVGYVSDWAGSYHVRDMAGHFRDYFETKRQLGLHRPLGFPPVHPYTALTFKQRAGGVTGNAGEVAAAIFARDFLGILPGELVLVRAAKQFGSWKAPDYMMRLNARGLLTSLWAGIHTLPPGLPDWWPVEAKARTSKNAGSAARDALLQLGAYWRLIAVQAARTGKVAPEVGFGMSILTALEKPGTMEAQLFLPINQVNFSAALVAMAPSAPGPDRAFLQTHVHHV